MAKLKAPVSFAGYDFAMYGGDREHAPRHLHISDDNEWELRIYFRACVLKEQLIFDVKFPKSRRDTGWCPLKSNQKRRLLELIEQHLDTLDAQWELLNPRKP